MLIPRFLFTEDFTPFEERLTQLSKGKKRISAGQRIDDVHMVNPVNACYIRTGSAKLSYENADGTEKIFFLLGKGSLYPINCMPEVFSAELCMHMTALTDMELQILAPESLLQMTGESAEFARVLINYYCKVVNLFLVRDILTSYSDSEQLVASFLYAYAHQQAGGMEIHLTQEMIGAFTGLSRAHLTRILGELRKEGIVQTRRGRLDIIDMPKLKALCESSVLP